MESTFSTLGCTPANRKSPLCLRQLLSVISNERKPALLVYCSATSVHVHCQRLGELVGGEAVDAALNGHNGDGLLLNDGDLHGYFSGCVVVVRKRHLIVTRPSLHCLPQRNAQFHGDQIMPASSPSTSDEFLIRLLDIVDRIAADGDFTAVGPLLEMTSAHSQPPLLTALAEGFARMVVKLEARDYELECTIQDLRAAKTELEKDRVA